MWSYEHQLRWFLCLDFSLTTLSMKMNQKWISVDSLNTHQCSIHAQHHTCLTFHISLSSYPAYKSFSCVCEFSRSIPLNSCLHTASLSRFVIPGGNARHPALYHDHAGASKAWNVSCQVTGRASQERTACKLLQGRSGGRLIPDPWKEIHAKQSWGFMLELLMTDSEIPASNVWLFKAQKTQHSTSRTRLFRFGISLYIPTNTKAGCMLQLNIK